MILRPKLFWLQSFPTVVVIVGGDIWFAEDDDPALQRHRRGGNGKSDKEFKRLYGQHVEVPKAEWLDFGNMDFSPEDLDELGDELRQLGVKLDQQVFVSHYSEERRKFTRNMEEDRRERYKNFLAESDPDEKES